jgi:ketosteroid isomerase-like protein
MPEENVEIVRSFYEAFNRRDWDAAFRDLAPDGELTTPPGPRGGTYRGREECQGYMEGWITAFEVMTVEPEEIFECGDEVVVFVRVGAQPKGSSAEIEIRNGHVWTIRNGKAQSMRIFPERERALEAAGLSEYSHRRD